MDVSHRIGDGLHSRIQFNSTQLGKNSFQDPYLHDIPFFLILCLFSIAMYYS